MFNIPFIGTSNLIEHNIYTDTQKYIFDLVSYQRSTDDLIFVEIYNS